MRDLGIGTRRGLARVKLALLTAVLSFVVTGVVIAATPPPQMAVSATPPGLVDIGPPPVSGDATAGPPQPTPLPAAPVPAPKPAPTPDVPVPTADPVPVLAPAVPYVADLAEPEPEVKEVASHFVQAVTSYGPGATADSVAAEVAAAHGVDADALAPVLGEIVHPDAHSTGAIVYPQLGGLQPNAASVMVVVAQSVLLADGTTLEESRTMDVRMRRDETGWHVAGLASDGGPRTARPADLGAVEAAVVDHPAIELPDSSRWDIYRGLVSPALLQRMLDMAERHSYSVNVLMAGHPYHVFGTSNVSHHSSGRAVDVYLVDGRLVVDSHEEGSPTHQLSRWLFEDDGVPNMGGPWAFDGVGGRSFSDALHQDHLHITAAAA